MPENQQSDYHDRADGAVVPAYDESVGRNIFKRLSSVSAELQNATVETEVRV